jgi:hypothetical protein
MCYFYLFKLVMSSIILYGARRTKIETINSIQSGRYTTQITR